MALLVLILLLSAQEVFGQILNFRNYDVDEGLPSETVFAVEQDRQGYMWFGTNAGLCHFDGVSFKRYSIEDGLNASHILALFEDILLRIKFSDLNLGILHKLDAGQNRVPEDGRAEAVHGKSRVYTP